MGSPVSVTVANLVMEDVEERTLSTCPHPPHPFWKRYVDDTFTALPEDQVDWFLDHLNMVEPWIKFTMEKESNGSLSFLDTLVTHHDDGSLSTSVYRKKTHTDRYLDFTSHHPLAHNVAVARTLMTRANRICTFMTDRDKEKQHIAEALNNNGYPSQRVNENWWPRSSPRPSSSEDPPKATEIGKCLWLLAWYNAQAIQAIQAKQCCLQLPILMDIRIIMAAYFDQTVSICLTLVVQ